ncbi:MAG: hypothetical protein RL236_219, partial [Pseudomonadota bacterium]
MNNYYVQSVSNLSLNSEEIAEKKRATLARKRDKEELELGLIDSKEFFNRESMRSQVQFSMRLEQEAKELENMLSALKEYVFLLVEPHLDTLLLKKKQLVRVDD